MLQGDKPLAQFQAKGKQKKELATPVALTPKWQSFSYEVGPFPEKFGDSEVKKIMFYLQSKGDGRIYVDNLNVTTKENIQVEEQTKTVAAELISNGSFEQGTNGFWINSQVAVKSDSTDATEGDRCIVVTPQEGKTVNIVQGFAFKSDKLYNITFDARSEDAEALPQIKLTFMLQGNKPLAFFAPKGEQKTQLAEAAAINNKWQKFKYQVGPFPEKYGNSEVKRVMLYFNIKGNGKVFIDNLKIEEIDPPAPDIVLLFPNPVQIYDSLSSFTVKAKVDNQYLRVTATDAFDRVVLTQTGKAGEGELAITLPNPDYYNIKVEIVDNGKINKEFKTSIVLTTPLAADYYETPHPAFGVWGGLTRELRALAGAKWDRQLFFTLFQKDNFQPTPPTSEQIANREPIKIIRCMNVLNPFKKMVPLSHEELLTQKVKLSKEVASKRGLVDVWETQNEPMVGENFHGKMEDVMDIMKMESDVVRKHDPNIPVAGICINPMNANQYNQYVGYYRNHGINDYVDSIMLHPYIPGAQSPDASGYVDILNRLGNEVSAIAKRRVPMYISEIGYSTRPGGEVSELQQAAYLARVVLLNRLIPDLVACVWHIGIWNDATSQRELDFGLLRKYVNGDPKREPKPAFAAWATVSRQTYNAEFIRELNIGRQVRVLLFEREGKPLIVAYSLTQDTANFQLPINSSQVTITEVCGKSYQQKLEDGILSLKLTEAPVYISGGTLSDFDSGKFSATFEPELFQTTAGVPLSIKVTLPAGLKGKLRVQNIPNIKTTATEANGSWTLTFAPELGAKPEIKDIFIRLDDDGVSRYIWQKSLEILPPLSLAKVSDATVDNLPAISFDVISNSNQKTACKLEIVADNKQTLATSQIESGGNYKLKLDNPKYGRDVKYQAKFTNSSGTTWSQELPNSILPVMIPYCHDAINKQVTAWPKSGTYQVADGTPSRHSVRGEFDQPDGEIRLSYDDENLYFSLQLKDKTAKTGNGASLWDGDALQIAVSVPQKFMIRPNNDGIQETAYAEFGIKIDEQTPQTWVWASMNLNELPLNQPIVGVINKSERIGDASNYLFAIPWKSLNIKPSLEMPLGISILINDRDDGKDRHWLAWYGGIADGKVPERYGSAKLID